MPPEITIFRSILSPDHFIRVSEEFNEFYNPWVYSKVENTSYITGRDSQTRFGFSVKANPQGVGDNLTFLDLSVTFRLIAQKVLRTPLKLTRVNTNIQFFGQEATFHQDGCADSWTFLLFAAEQWRTDWGGEFVCKTSDGYYRSVAYIPNDAVLFRADLPHRGSAPNSLCSEARKSLAFTYTHV